MLILSTLLSVLVALSYTTSRAWNRTVRGASDARPRAQLLEEACAVALALATVRFARTSAGLFFGVATGVVAGHLLGHLMIRDDR